jgi:transposase
MQKKRRPRYTREFKERAVQLSAEKTVKQVADELDVSTASIVKWRAEFGSSSTRNTSGSLSTREMRNLISELQRENEMLKKEKTLAEMEREILKKSTVFFARENG